MTADAVRAEQIVTLYRQSVPVLLANVLNAAIVSATLWSAASHPFLLVWTATMALMTLIRIWLRRSYWRSQPSAAEAPRWGTFYVIGSLTAGILWGTAAVVLFDVARPVSQVLIAFVIGGMGAGAAGTISCYPPAFLVYLIPSVLPMAVRMFGMGQPLYLAMGTMSVIYGVAISAVARISNRALTAAFRLRFENEVLVQRLSTTQLTLEESNHTLERRVAERSQELERQAEALRNAQRMETVGRLAGGIAHDFNNLLTVVLANASKLVRDDQLPPTAKAALEDVRGAATRGADLVRQLLTFSRRQRTVPRTLDLNRVVRDIQRLLARLLGERIDLSVVTAQEPLLVSADASQLEQVVVNLATNARDAISGGGKVTICTSPTIIEDGHPVLAPGGYAVLSVIDTGTGMDAQTLRQAFDPFFTTKEPGQGTGLGLATVHGIVQQSGGHVAVTSQPGEGSRFDVHLPLRSERRLEETTPDPGRAERAAPATILLAEDEPIVRSVIVMALESEGHKVLSARDGEAALALLHDHPGTVDLLVTDVVMAKLGGPELARRVREQQPAVRVLFISGYSFETELSDGSLGAQAEVLEKPFTMETLLQRISRVLTTRTGRAQSPS
jgi:signal transduction histidine kinase/ActR/RegA family two-component response regulator